MPTQISSPYGLDKLPNVNPSSGQPNYSLATTYINMSNMNGPPLSEVSDHYTNVRQGPGTGGSYPVDLNRGPMMGPSAVGLPMVHEGWSQGAPGSYSGGGALGEATPPYMGTSGQTFNSPSWWPGVQRGDYPGNVSGSHGSVSVSSAPLAEISNQYAQKSPWHASDGNVKGPAGSIYSVSQSGDAFDFNLSIAEFGIVAVALIATGLAVGQLMRESKWTTPFYEQYRRGFKDVYEGEREGGLF